MPEGNCLVDVIEGGFPQTLSILLRKSLLPEDITEFRKPHYIMGD